MLAQQDDSYLKKNPLEWPFKQKIFRKPEKVRENLRKSLKAWVLIKKIGFLIKKIVS